METADNKTIEYSSNIMSGAFSSWRGLPTYLIIFYLLVASAFPVGFFLLLNYETITTGDPTYRLFGLLLFGLLIAIIFVFLAFYKVTEKRVIMNSELIKVFYRISTKKNYQEKISDCLGYFSYKDMRTGGSGGPGWTFGIKFYLVLILKFKDNKILVIKGKSDDQQTAIEQFKKILNQAGVKTFDFDQNKYLAKWKDRGLYKKESQINKIFEDNGITNITK